jgi:hypothetical protein
VPSANPRSSETKLMDSTRNPADGPAAVPTLPADGDVAAVGAPEAGAEAAVAGREPDGVGPELAGVHAASVTTAASVAMAAAARQGPRPAARAECFVTAASWPGQRAAGWPAPPETVLTAGSLPSISCSPATRQKVGLTPPRSAPERDNNG